MFGQRLEQLRTARGISQIELARLSGLSSGHLSLLENDLRHPTLVTLRKLAAALQCSIDDLAADPTPAVPLEAATTRLGGC